MSTTICESRHIYFYLWVEETWNDRGSDGRTSFMNEHATRINLHEHEDDEKGNGLCNVIASYAARAYRKGN